MCSHRIRLYTALGSTRCLPSAPGYRNGSQGSHGPRLFCRECTNQHSRRIVHVMATMDCLRYLSWYMRKFDCCKYRGYIVAAATWVCFHSRGATYSWNLVVSRISSLADDQGAAQSGLCFSASPAKQPSSSCSGSLHDTCDT